MKKYLSIIAMAAIISAVSACSGAAAISQEKAMNNTVSEAAAVSENEQPTIARAAKVAVNFEGAVTEVNGNEITLENGKTVVITDETVFGGDPDTENAVRSEIAVGNFIQGFTQDDPEADRMTANKVWSNIAVQEAPTMGKAVINYEGTVTEVDGDTVTLDSGKTVKVTDETKYSLASGTVNSIILHEGLFVQGYTADDPESDEITAVRMHIVIF